MSKIELTEEQRKAMIELINNSQFIGSSAEFIVGLKIALQKPINDIVEDHVNDL